VLLFLIFAVSSDGFLSAYNFKTVSRNVGFWVIVALAQAFVVVVGGMNLSVGAIGGLATITTGYLIERQGLPGTVAGGAAVLVGITAGGLNGWIITKFKINAFVTTLATMFIFTGLVHGISGGYAYTKIPKEFKFLGQQMFLGISSVFWVMAVVLVIVHVMFNHTVLGRRLLAVGGNLEASRLSGINTDRILMAANLLSGGLAAFAAVLWVSKNGSAQPATGAFWLLPSFAVAIVGGTSLTGGRISALGLLMGGIIIVLIRNGLIMLNVNTYYEQTFLGLIILLAVGVDRVREIYGGKLRG
jgi:ribose transport system permease protein